jgi:hypothetical protein
MSSAPALPGCRAVTDWIIAFFLFLYALMTAHGREMLISGLPEESEAFDRERDWWMRKAHFVGCLGLVLG